MPRGRRGRPAGALYQHAVRVYGQLNAEGVKLGDAPADVRALVPDGAEVRLWAGDLAGRMAQLGYGSYYVSRVRRLLLEMGCLLRMGRGVWLLLGPPTEAAYRQLGHDLDSRTAEHRQRHDEVIGRWLQVAGYYHPALLQAAMDAGNQTVGELLDWLAGLPESRRRTLPPCFGFRGSDSHTCLVPSLDVLADRSAGSLARRREHLEQLTAAD